MCDYDNFLRRMIIIISEIIDGKEYRLVTVRGRSKLIARDGSAINPHRRKQIASIHYNSDGYPCFGGGAPVHLYVAKAWVDGWFEGAEVNHKDFDRTNFNADNLEWITHRENILHSRNNNSDVWFESKRGVNNGRATFTEEEVKGIRKLYDNGMRIYDIMDIYRPNITDERKRRNAHSTFRNICKRITWKHIA